MQAYKSIYEEHKASRTLEWKPGLGLVKMELEFDDGREFNQVGRLLMCKEVSAVHAAIILKFEEQPSWELKELAAALEMEGDILRKKISFWLNHRILKEVSAGRPLPITSRQL